MVLDLVTMVIAAILSSLAVTLRSSTGFTGASLVTLMSFGDQLTQIVIFLTLLETSLGETSIIKFQLVAANRETGAITRLQDFGANVTSEEKKTEVLRPVEGWPQQGSVELSKVSASYRYGCSVAVSKFRANKEVPARLLTKSRPHSRCKM